MGWGFWNKIKNAFKKAGSWIKEKIIKPVGRTVKKIFKSEPVQGALDLVSKAGGAIGAGIGAAKGNPQMGAQIGMVAQNLAGQLKNR